MRVIVPITPTLVSSTVPALDIGEVLYSPTTPYALGATATSQTSHMIYESLQAANTGHAQPVPPEKKNDWWAEAGTSNRYAALDMSRNTQSVGASPMTITIAPGCRVNAVALMGIEADSARIQMISSGAVVYDKSFDLRLRVVRNGYDYAFKPFDLQASVVQFDIPPFYSATITVTLTRSTGIAKLGSLLVGTYAYLGQTQYNAVNDALNFSTFDRDIYGSATLVPRRTLPKTTQTLLVDKALVNDLIDVRTRLNAVPALWSGLDDRGDDGYFEALLVLGVYKQFSINTSLPLYAEVTLELEEF